MLPRSCGTDQETNLYTAAVWWTVHPELVLADTLCKGCSSSFSPPSPPHSVSWTMCQWLGFTWPPKQKIFQVRWVAVNQHISLKC